MYTEKRGRGTILVAIESGAVTGPGRMPRQLLSGIRSTAPNSGHFGKVLPFKFFIEEEVDLTQCDSYCQLTETLTTSTVSLP